MGYGFICNHRKNDEETVFYTECQYSYQPIFREAFGIEISKMSGKVTKGKILVFKEGLNNLKSNKDVYSQQVTNFIGNLSNRNYDGVIDDFETIIKLMEEQKVGYISIA